jgi:hypothetical protein
MCKLVTWISAVVGHWGSIVTSGALIGALAIWQGTGHYVPRYTYWVIAICGLLFAFYRAWAAEYDAKQELQIRFDHIETSRPKIRLKELFSDYTTFITSAGTEFIAQSIFIRLVNEPENPFPNAEARNLIAKVRFFNEAGRLLLEIDGRWAESDQPSVRDFRQSRVDISQMSFGIGAAHHIGIGFQDPTTHDFIAFNEENYAYPNFIKPEHRLPETYLRVELHVTGVWVDETFTASFQSSINGLQVLSEAEEP